MNANSHEDSTGKTLTIGGRYQVRRVLGTGGMGVVYEARHTWTGRLVAVKVLAADRVSEKGFDQRFAREARATARVRHANVVDVLDSGFDPDAGGFYIVQERLVGEDLRAHIARVGRVAPNEAVALMVAVADGLAAAHAHQIVHRDVKPANIFLTTGPDGAAVPKVIDFGVSKLLDEPASADTTTGQLLGTPRYMAPEQLRGERDIDARADVWAAGAVLYELLAGRPAFEASNHNLLVFEVLSEAPVAPIADVPDALFAIVRRALSRDRAQRYNSMGDLRDALIAWRDGAPAPAPPKRRGVIAVASAVMLVLGAIALRVSLHRDVPRVIVARPTPAATPAPALTARLDAATAPPGPIVEAPTQRPAQRPNVARAPRHHGPAPTPAVDTATQPAPPTPAPSSRARLLEPSVEYP